MKDFKSILVEAALARALLFLKGSILPTGEELPGIT